MGVTCSYSSAPVFMHLENELSWHCDIFLNDSFSCFSLRINLFVGDYFYILGAVGSKEILLAMIM